MIEPSVECWGCDKIITLAARSRNDGFCPYCHSEIELDEFDDDEHPFNIDQ
jgi:rRNA maturation endonuclease Nob1